jgi:DNA polymerase-3 subunit alpha
MTGLDSCWCHPHVHSRYSFRDGLAHVESLVAKAAFMGQPGIALTDHGILYGMPNLFEAAKMYRIKAIPGMEGYEAAVEWDFDMERDGEVFKIKWADLGDRARYYHITLWALTPEGWENLVWLHTNSFRTEYHPTVRGKPLIDRKSLSEHSAGLAVGLGCIASRTNQTLIKGDEDQAYEAAKYYADVFEDRCFMEIMGNLPDQVALQRGQRRIAHRLGIDVLAANDVHYLDRADGVEDGPHHVLVRSRAFKKADTEASTDKSDDGFGQWYGSDGFFLKSAQQMLETGFTRPDLEASMKLLGMLDFDFDSLPAPQPPAPQVPMLGDDPAFDAYCMSVYEDEAEVRRLAGDLMA